MKQLQNRIKKRDIVRVIHKTFDKSKAYEVVSVRKNTARVVTKGSSHHGESIKIKNLNWLIIYD
tara:strand:+ start:49 stop:240 length:192 start_codon:yes stop_codon:yes gene_type:complete